MNSLDAILKSPRTPKLQVRQNASRAHWYPYYAGYSPEFVEDMIKIFDLPKKDALVLDPWNGSGTTTTMCAEWGVVSAGFDINPAMIVVAKARLLARNTSPSLSPILSALIESAASGRSSATKREPLRAWFTDATAARIRLLVKSVSELLVHSRATIEVDNLSSLASFYYVLIFRLARRLTRQLAVSNPTWFRKDVPESDKVCASWSELKVLLHADLEKINLVDQASASPVLADAAIKIGDSQSLPIADRTVDAVIASPPYCTRIDYAAATRLELAILGYTEAEVKDLRTRMLGTTLSADAPGEFHSASDEVARLLDRIRTHPSKASGSYYYRTYCDYFSKLERSFSEISRVSRVGGQIALVVQESAYKEVRIDLAKICAQYMEGVGFAPIGRWDFKSSRSMGKIKSATTEPIESVLAFRRA